MSVMTMSPVLEKVTVVLVDELGVEIDEVKPGAKIKGDLEAEDVDFLVIVFRLERELGIAIPPGDLSPKNAFQGGSVDFPKGETMTVQDIVDYVEKKLNP